MDLRIAPIVGREVLVSRRNPTIAVDVSLADGAGDQAMAFTSGLKGAIRTLAVFCYASGPRDGHRIGPRNTSTAGGRRGRPPAARHGFRMIVGGRRCGISAGRGIRLV